MRKNTFALLAIFIALMLATPTSAAVNAFKINAEETTETLCPTTTSLLIIPIENIGSASDTYTISLSGSAAKWAVSAPAGFGLEAGQTKDVYVYITPSMDALVGTYDLKITVNAEKAGAQYLTNEIKIKNCHGVDLDAITTSRTVCACTMAKYELNLENTGQYTENFALSLTGSAAKWAAISNTLVRLSKGEDKDIIVYVTTPCDKTGDFGITVTASSQDSNVVDSAELKLKIEPCYEYILTPAANYYSFCEHTEIHIPITIENQGTADNSYSLTVDGPDWANLEHDKVEIASGGESTINLVLFPDYRVAGNFEIKITAISKVGDVVNQIIIDTNVQTCHSTDLKISKHEEKMCATASRSYDVSLMNTGNFTEHYALTVEGPDWANLDESFIDLDAGETKKLILSVSPPLTAPELWHTIKIRAQSQDSCQTTDEDQITITIVSKTGCFGVKTTAQLKDVEVMYGEGALVPVTIENKGSEESTYNLEVSGRAASWAQLNPASVKLSPGDTETVYIYIAVPETTKAQEYTLTVSARLKDGTISSSDEVRVKVVEVKEKEIIPLEGIAENVTPEAKSIKAKIEAAGAGVSGFFASIGAKVSGIIATVQSAAAGIPYVGDYWRYIVAAIVVIIVIIAIWRSGAIKRIRRIRIQKPKKKGKNFLNKVGKLLEEEEEGNSKPKKKK